MHHLTFDQEKKWYQHLWFIDQRLRRSVVVSQGAILHFFLIAGKAIFLKVISYHAIVPTHCSLFICFAVN